MCTQSSAVLILVSYNMYFLLELGKRKIEIGGVKRVKKVKKVPYGELKKIFPQIYQIHSEGESWKKLARHYGTTEGTLAVYANNYKKGTL